MSTERLGGYLSAPDDESRMPSRSMPWLGSKISLPRKNLAAQDGKSG
jgi:hypothetical protein